MSLFHHRHGHSGRTYSHRGIGYTVGYTPLMFSPPPASGFVACITGLFLIGASIAFLAAFILPIIFKVLLSLMLIAGAVALGSAAYHLTCGA